MKFRLLYNRQTSAHVNYTPLVYKEVHETFEEAKKEADRIIEEYGVNIAIYELVQQADLQPYWSKS